MPPKITRRTPIGELIMNHPSAVEILFGYGFHCIGCGLSSYETIEEGAAAHGFDDSAIDKLVEELNAAAKKMPAPLPEAGLERARASGKRAPSPSLTQESVAVKKNPAAPKKAVGAKKKPGKTGKQGV